MKFNLRLPNDLKVRLKLEALRNGRSLNAEIVHRLLRSLDAGRYRP
jgi:predicted HicB family RNase H-like nuclease